MALVLRSIVNYYDYIYVTLKDPRTANFPLIGDSPFPVIFILFCYAILCKYGPRYMESRNPFELKSTILVYNFMQIIFNSVGGSVAAYYLLWKYKYNFSCQPVDYSDSEHGMAEAIMIYLYFPNKVLDLADTVFIVLKKKNSQMSFLHIFHHGGMVLASYIVAKWLPGGPISIVGIINTFVHTVMYTYYFLCGLKSELKKSFWWKKYITQIQMVQFSFLVFHFSRTLLFQKDCNYPKALLGLYLAQNLCFLVLFGNFYRKTYWKKKIN